MSSRIPPRPAPSIAERLSERFGFEGGKDVMPPTIFQRLTRVLEALLNLESPISVAELQRINEDLNIAQHDYAWHPACQKAFNELRILTEDYQNNNYGQIEDRDEFFARIDIKEKAEDTLRILRADNPAAEVRQIFEERNIDDEGSNYETPPESPTSEQGSLIITGRPPSEGLIRRTGTAISSLFSSISGTSRTVATHANRLANPDKAPPEDFARLDQLIDRMIQGQFHITDRENLLNARDHYFSGNGWDAINNLILKLDTFQRHNTEEKFAAFQECARSFKSSIAAQANAETGIARANNVPASDEPLATRVTNHIVDTATRAATQRVTSQVNRLLPTPLQISSEPVSDTREANQQQTSYLNRVGSYVMQTAYEWGGIRQRVAQGENPLLILNMTLQSIRDRGNVPVVRYIDDLVTALNAVNDVIPEFREKVYDALRIPRNASTYDIVSNLELNENPIHGVTTAIDQIAGRFIIEHNHQASCSQYEERGLTLLQALAAAITSRQQEVKPNYFGSLMDFGQTAYNWMRGAPEGSEKTPVFLLQSFGAALEWAIKRVEGTDQFSNDEGTRSNIINAIGQAIEQVKRGINGDIGRDVALGSCLKLLQQFPVLHEMGLLSNIGGWVTTPQDLEAIESELSERVEDLRRVTRHEMLAKVDQDALYKKIGDDDVAKGRTVAAKNPKELWAAAALQDKAFSPLANVLYFNETPTNKDYLDALNAVDATHAGFKKNVLKQMAKVKQPSNFEILREIRQKQKLTDKPKDSEFHLDALEATTDKNSKDFTENLALLSCYSSLNSRFLCGEIDPAHPIDEKPFDRIILESTRNGRVDHKLFMNALWQEIDKRNISWIRKIWSWQSLRFVHWVVNSISGEFMKNILDKVRFFRDSYHEQSHKKINLTPINKINGFADSYKKGLRKLAYNGENGHGVDPHFTGRSPDVAMEMILRRPELNHNLTTEQIHSKTSRHVIHQFLSTYVAFGTKRLGSALSSITSWASSDVIKEPSSTAESAANILCKAVKWVPALVGSVFIGGLYVAASIGKKIFGGIFQSVAQSALKRGLDSTMEITESSLKKDSQYEYAVKKVVIEQLKEVYSILQEDSGEEMETSQPNRTKREINSLVTNLFEILEYRKAANTPEELRNLMERVKNQGIYHKLSRLSKDALLPTISNTVVELIIVAYQSILKKEQAEKQLGNFFELLNEAMTNKSDPITQDEKKKLDEDLLHWRDRILEVSVSKAVRQFVQVDKSDFETNANKYLENFRTNLLDTKIAKEQVDQEVPEIKKGYLTKWSGILNQAFPAYDELHSIHLELKKLVEDLATDESILENHRRIRSSSLQDSLQKQTKPIVKLLERLQAKFDPYFSNERSDNEHAHLSATIDMMQGCLKRFYEAFARNHTNVQANRPLSETLIQDLDDAISKFEAISRQHHSEIHEYYSLLQSKLKNATTENEKQSLTAQVTALETILVNIDGTTEQASLIQQMRQIREDVANYVKVKQVSPTLKSKMRLIAQLKRNHPNVDPNAISEVKNLIAQLPQQDQGTLFAAFEKLISRPEIDVNFNNVVRILQGIENGYKQDSNGNPIISKMVSESFRLKRPFCESYDIIKDIWNSEKSTHRSMGWDHAKECYKLLQEIKTQTEALKEVPIFVANLAQPLEPFLPYIEDHIFGILQAQSDEFLKVLDDPNITLGLLRHAGFLNFIEACEGRTDSSG